jgi:hypothetical protein
MKKIAFWTVLSASLIAVFFLTTSCANPQVMPTYMPGVMGPGGMMGPGGGSSPGGMMGPGGPYRSSGERISMEQATQIVEEYLNDRNDPDLEVKEIMEFSYNFYIGFEEESTGIHAFEALIDPFTGDLYPEPGPNMMWNARYGMMSGMMWSTPGDIGPMTVSEDEAREFAQKFIDSYLPGGKVDEPDRFYGYYTLHVLEDEKIYGMLSVNGYTGEVWYHFWHGPFLGMEELGEQ